MNRFYMNKWKNELKKAFDAPIPLRKQSFLHELEVPSISIVSFLLSQLGYIRKRVWCVSILIFILALSSSFFFPVDYLWFIAALTPILALTILSESGRSTYYGMAELEMATRFSLRNILLARLAILGLNNLFLLCLLTLISFWHHVLNPLAIGLYIITPFLLTTFSGLLITCKLRNHEAFYYCMGSAVFISFSLLISRNTIPYIFQENYMIWWLLTAILLCLGIYQKLQLIINQKEEFIWN